MHYMEAETLHFVFVARQRVWHVAKGEPEPPVRTYFEVRSLPGNVVAAGETLDEADANLRKSLELAFDRHGVTTWYDRAMVALRKNKDDREMFAECGGRALLERKLEPMPLMGKSMHKAERALMRSDCGLELSFA